MCINYRFAAKPLIIIRMRGFFHKFAISFAIHSVLMAIRDCIPLTCPGLEILECTQKIQFRDYYANYEPLRFRNLKKFIFKFVNYDQIQILKGIFKNASVELIANK